MKTLIIIMAIIFFVSTAQAGFLQFLIKKPVPVVVVPPRGER